ncbi:isochorismatase family protein [Eggerthellaceae bacterium zg-1084]|uniref:nicotinamidase n=1 Tax=Berryella wangjianweii TaxID=2734634 RepID=A0A6M8J3F9_9ACTN|nr:isochorismatase family protein [Berryella wangjianweii]NPD30467.1 isochorismatase family protein [Berryella wangjianweii]QKF07133.1 isochorismatase family protein [Berryella wangjianweii]
MNRALIIVDMQPTFCEEGELPVQGGNLIAARIAAFARAQSPRYRAVITTQDWHIDPGRHFSDAPDFIDTWPAHGVAGSPNAKLHPLIDALPIDARLRKGAFEAAYSGFEARDREGRALETLLRRGGIECLDVVGLAESHCVLHTALDAVRNGWPVRVLTDLTAPVSPALGEAARARMADAGVVLLTSAQAFE